MVSINDHPTIWECFAGFHVEALDIPYSHGGGGMQRRTGNSQSGPWTTMSSQLVCFDVQTFNAIQCV